MRKMMNKKGFSLSELMLVVALMGLVLAIAVPVYNNLHKRAENKSCSTNVEIIQLAVVEYYTSYQKAPTSLNDLTPFLDEGGVPLCSKSVDGKVEYHYGIAAVKNADGTYSGQVICACKDEGHEPEDVVDSFPSGSKVLQEAKTVNLS